MNFLITKPRPAHFVWHSTGARAWLWSFGAACAAKCQRDSAPPQRSVLSRWPRLRADQLACVAVPPHVGHA
eukprot:4382027-Pyramimonas_sp.AAC.1